MYFYFYDKFVQEKKYEVTRAKIETRLIELGINGRIEKLALFKNTRELIEDGIKKGAHTVVAVGDDATLCRVVTVAAAYKVMVGYIPIVAGSRFGSMLGIPVAEGACEVLAKRLYRTIDLGKINQVFFLGAVELSARTAVQLWCDDNYRVALVQQTNELLVLNLGDIVGGGVNGKSARLARGTDGKLEVVILPQVPKKFWRACEEQASVLLVKKIRINSADNSNPSVEIIADNITKFRMPCTIEIVPKKIKLIVGKQRRLKE